MVGLKSVPGRVWTVAQGHRELDQWQMPQRQEAER